MTSAALRTAAALLVPLVMTACAAPSYGGASGKQIASGNVSASLPARVAGLDVRKEKLPKKIADVQHSYVDGVAFYSLRKDTNVQGTLQIAHFSKVAPLESASFRKQLEAEVLVGGLANTVLVGGIAVQQTTGLKSVVSEWIQGDQLFVLTVLQSYPMGRGLLAGVVKAVHA